MQRRDSLSRRGEAVVRQHNGLKRSDASSNTQLHLHSNRPSGASQNAGAAPGAPTCKTLRSGIEESAGSAPRLRARPSWGGRR